MLEGVGRGKGASRGEVGESLGRGSPCSLERRQGSGGGFSGGQRDRNGHQVQHSDRDKRKSRIRERQGQTDYSWGSGDGGKERLARLVSTQRKEIGFLKNVMVNDSGRFVG